MKISVKCERFFDAISEIPPGTRSSASRYFVFFIGDQAGFKSIR